MTKDKKDNFYPSLDENESEGDGSSGQTGAIEFVDFLSNPKSERDDLSSSDQKHLLNLHENATEVTIKKTKELVDNREKLKNEKNRDRSYMQGNEMGTGYGSESKYDTHPLLTYDGADPQTSTLPNNQETAANSELKEKHELQNRPQHTHQPKPSFNPKPMMP